MLDHKHQLINCYEDAIYISHIQDFKKIIDLNNTLYVTLHIFKKFKNYHKINIPISLFKKYYESKEFFKT